MNLESIEHVVIREPKYVFGSNEEPEIKVFVETHKGRRPLDTSRLKTGQKIWMKWSSGPIVAKAELKSWKPGKIEDGDVSEIRDLCRGTKLYDVDSYWKFIAKKDSFDYLVIRIQNEEWLEKAKMPIARSYGSSWIILDDEEKKKDWILKAKPLETALEELDGRSIPDGIRYDILKRDGHTCQYCGHSAPDVELEVDHKKPWSEVKNHTLDNLITACKRCNRGKSDKT